MQDQSTVLRDVLLSRGQRSAACLLWTGPVTRGGYGLVSVRSQDRWRTRLVHRVAYEVFIGPITSGAQVQHSCNVRHCFEPAHLSLGTVKENAEYMLACGRSTRGRVFPDSGARGERNRHAILTEAGVVAIRVRYAAGSITQESLAAELGVLQSTVGRIIRGETWRHAGGPIVRVGKGRKIPQASTVCHS
jgi:hypothetical protein